MLLADLGAEVIRVDRVSTVQAGPGEMTRADHMGRGRRSLAVDLKTPGGVEAVLRLAATADALFEPFRPGVAERLGIGPDVCLARNPQLVYGRMTGWGQEGPYAQMAGHDINYIALAGALAPIGRKGQGPIPPLNLVGDYGGGGMLLAFGLLAALLETQRSGKGQVVDAAMVDGAAILMTVFYGLYAAGNWSLERGTNMLDTGAHFYDVYETADGEYVSIGSIEPQFYAELLRLTGLEKESLPDQMDRSGCRRSRRKWRRSSAPRAAMSGVRSWKAAIVLLRAGALPRRSAGASHKPAAQSLCGGWRPPAAGAGRRASAATANAAPLPPPRAGGQTDEILRAAGFSQAEIQSLRGDGAVA